MSLKTSFFSNRFERCSMISFMAVSSLLFIPFNLLDGKEKIGAGCRFRQRLNNLSGTFSHIGTLRTNCSISSFVFLRSAAACFNRVSR